MPRFVHEFRIPRPSAEVFAWHERPGAFERLAPPWMRVGVRARTGTIRDGGELELEVGRKGVSFAWRLRHRDYEEGRTFTDEQVKGPFRRWVHVHRFEDDGADGTRIVDEIDWDVTAGRAVRGLAVPVVERELSRVFAFRKRRLIDDLRGHAVWMHRPPLSVAISGAGGLIGSALSDLLTTGGHRVRPLVRSREAASRIPGALYWSPAHGEIDLDGLRGVDAVVHLAGEPIVRLPRWTPAKKRSILESRVRGTELISGALAGLRDAGPTILVSSSGVGYYGDRGDEVLDEETDSGRGFLAEVTGKWESATRRASSVGLRVVIQRQGPALCPAGGMLGRLMIPFSVGMGGRVGSGKQYVSWIDLDDATGAILHALMDDRVEGAINVCAPEPVTNAEFADALGRVLGRPTLVPLPVPVVRAGLGEMGREVLLFGQRAHPARLLEAGYRFRFERLEDSLRHQLGRSLGSPGRLPPPNIDETR